MRNRNSRSGKAYLTSVFRYSEKVVVFGRARLFPDRVELSGFEGLRWRKSVIPLASIEEIDWWAGRPDVNLALYLDTEEDVLIYVKGVGNWKFKLEQLLERTLTEKPYLPSPEAEDALPPKVKSLDTGGDQQSHAA